MTYGDPPPAWPTPEQPAWPAPAPSTEPRRGLRRTAGFVVGVVLAVTAVGVPYGLLWAALAPDIPLIRVDGGVITANAAPEQFVAGDGWFALLGLAFGVLVGIAGWTMPRRLRGPVGLLAITVGGVAAGMLAGYLGQNIGLGDYRRTVAAAAPGTELTHPPDLRVAEEVFDTLPLPSGVSLVLALAAVVTYALLAGWSRYASLRPEPAVQWAEPAARWTMPAAVSSGSWAAPDPPTPPAPPGSDAATPPRG